MRKILTIVFCAMGIFASGCSKSHQGDSLALQGKWSGQEVGAKSPGSPTLMVEGAKLEFHGVNPAEWYKATFSLREDTTPKQLEAVVTECPFPKYVGKTSHGIYKIADGKFTFAANEPGDPATPANFDTPSARQFVFMLK